MCWAYLITKPLSNRLKIYPNLYLLLLCGILPDIDLLLGAAGLQHRTLTHSVLFWSLLFAPIFAKYRWVALPYFVAVTQHILFGDLVVGSTPILWPLLDLKLGLGLSILSPTNLILEGIGLALFVLMIVFGRERQLLLAPGRSGFLALLIIAPLFGFLALTMGSGGHISLLLDQSDAKHLERNITSLLANNYFQVVLGLHIGMLLFMLIPLLRASFAMINKRFMEGKRIED